jgi:hypothetical protein
MFPPRHRINGNSAIERLVTLPLRSTEYFAVIAVFRETTGRPRVCVRMGPFGSTRGGSSWSVQVIVEGCTRSGSAGMQCLVNPLLSLAKLRQARA